MFVLLDLMNDRIVLTVVSFTSTSKTCIKFGRLMECIALLFSAQIEEKNNHATHDMFNINLRDCAV